MNTIIFKDNQQGITRDINQKEYLSWLGGFFEGEGSASVSISISSTFKFGVQLQPTFNVSQHENGLPILQSFKDLFDSVRSSSINYVGATAPKLEAIAFIQSYSC